ncbi:hypothetical protein [Simplicispira lacusdiani]|uniref:hypothetical protein n=1 Tax=Simplicispira lacusdiani TaxID=2213010 RepID=UPI0013004CE0|nr:hypothetical protein [Simplicispira lacusdiani]
MENGTCRARETAPIHHRNRLMKNYAEVFSYKTMGCTNIRGFCRFLSDKQLHHRRLRALWSTAPQQPPETA